MKNEEMELVNDNGTWKIKWNDGFERSFESFFKAKLHFVALVNQTRTSFSDSFSRFRA